MEFLGWNAGYGSGCSTWKSLNIMTLCGHGRHHFDWLIEWCLMSSGKYFCIFRTRAYLWWVLMNEPCFVLDRHAEPYFNVLAHESNSSREDAPLYTDLLFWRWTDQSLLLLLNATCLEGKQQKPILMSGLSRLRIEPTTLM